MNSVLSLYRLRTRVLYFPCLLTLAGAVLATILLSCWSIKADIIYRETFGIPPTASGDSTATVFDWQRFDTNGFVTNGVAVNSTMPGRPADVANVNAGPNS